MIGSTKHAKFFIRWPAVSPLMLALAGLAPCAVADDGLAIEEVVVSALKRDEVLQEVPIAISAMTSADLENKGIMSFEGVAAATPSITLVPFPASSSTLVMFMRGQGNGNPGQVNSEGAVGLYLDGFYLARAQASTFDLADIERVEVLRGPQGTLYGRNTTGGAVNLISKTPTGEFGVKQSFTFGTRDLFRSLTAVNLPAWNGVAAKVSLLKSSIDGYVKNSGSSHDYGEQAQQAGRLQLHWDALDNLQADYFFETGTIDETPVYFQNATLQGQVIDGYTYTHGRHPAERTFMPVDLDLGTSRYQGHGLTVTWDVSDALSIKSLTGYRELDADYSQDYAGSFTYAPLASMSYRTRNEMQQHQFSQELQFIGNLLDGALDYVVGLYYFEEGGSGFQRTDIATFGQVTDTRVHADATSKAIYGQLTWTPPVFDERLEFTLGGRYTEDEREADRFQDVNGMVTEAGAATGTVADLDFDSFNPSFTAKYTFTDDVSAYLTVATAYRSGGVYTEPGAPRLSGFDPEEVTSREIGVKSYWFDRRLRLNLSAFDVDYSDMQVTYIADASNPAASLVLNAGEATIRGAELELLAQLTEDLTLTLDYAYLDAEIDQIDVIPGSVYDGAVNAASPYRVGDNIADLFIMPQTPDHSVSVAANYTVLRFDRGDLNAHLEYRWQDRYEGSNANQGAPVFPNAKLAEYSAYGLVNARLTLTMALPRGETARVSLWGKNILDEEYERFNIPFAYGAFPSDGGLYGNTIAWSEPAAYGVDLTYEF